MACAVIFNYYYVCVLCFFGWCARLFLFTTTNASFVCVGWCARLFLITSIISNFVLPWWRARKFLIITTIMSFVVLGWPARFFNCYYYHEFCSSRLVCTVIFNYYYYHEFCFLLQVAYAVIFNYYDYNEFCFPGGVRCHDLLVLRLRASCFGWRARLFFNCYYHCELCFRVVCAVIFCYYHYHEFCFPGWRARLFLITATSTSFVFRVVCAVML